MIRIYKIVLIFCSLFLMSINLFSQTTIISSTATSSPNGSFENATSTLAANGWTTVNDGTNLWIVGTSAFNGGAKSAYISDGAGANNYSNAGGEVSHFYRDVIFPAGESCINLTFDWKSRGDGTNDILRVILIPTTVTPVAGTALATGTVIGTFQSQATWQTSSNTLSSAYAGTTQRLVFSWENNGANRTQPPAAVDNISLTSSVTPTPGCATYVSPANSSTVCPTSQTLSWNAIAAPACGSILYDVYFNAGTTATTLVSSNQAGITYATGALSASTTYAWRIIPKNGSNSAAGCSTFTFATNSGGSGSTAPLTENFESCNDWTLVNGAQTNIWAIGTATNNGGSQSIYITNDGGTTNAYSNTTSRVHFYKDITFPAGVTCITLNFDWKSNGESTFDFLRVYAIPTTSTPIAGTAVTSGQLGGNLEVQNTWQAASLSLPSAYAGTTQRIVFSWVNDNSVRNQAPAAIDNISIIAGATPTPACTTYISPADGSTSCPTQTLSWNAAATPTCGTILYDVYLDAGLTATTVVSANQAGTTYNATGLSAGVYTWKIVPKNGAVSASGCTTFSFTVNGIANDLPCNAVNIVLGSIASGDNTCSGNAGEPATPGCWTGGTVNSVWYSFTAPASGNVKIRTAPGTLLNTQIAVYSGVCGVGMATVTSGCNRDAANCGLVTVLLSEVSLTGLTSGATYYVAVDGENSLVGTFAITIINAASSYPTTSGQDCSAPNTICTPTVQIGDPGNQGIGFTCDDDGSNNCTTGERGSVWYQITIASSGNLNFNITPNDYNIAAPAAETDYDFVLWKTSGTGATNCAAIAAGTAVPVACNYSGLGFSGVYTGGTRPPGGHNAAYDGSYEPTIAATVGETYLLLIENYSNSTSGFSLDLTNSGAAVVNYSTSTTIAWTGGANTTTWTASSNWGACNTPSCGIDAVVSVISTYQPLITSTMGTVSVNNFTVDPGAVLTLGPNSVLKICGNFTNNGTISADPTSTILFSDDATHNLNGTFSASSKLGNMVITDAAGGANCRVIANTSIELKGSLTTSNATSVFDLNGKNLLIGGDIINAAGANTFSNTAGSTITFNGSSAQTYNPNAISATPSLTLNNVTLSHSSTGVSISTTNAPNMILGTSGVLTLTSGKIITPSTQEVVVMNTALAAVSAGNTSSYVQGNLRRYLGAGAIGLFDFPVGHATPGYERASVDFKTGAAAGTIQLVARFDPWGGTFPTPAIPNWTECGTTYDLNYLNHGYWSIDASSPSTGLYDLTLYNRGYSNATGAGYSIAKSPSSAPSWTLNGTCVISPLTSVQRAGMSGFSKMATVQGSTPLPVELISFIGISEGTYNSVSWKSAVETNFKHYELESSEDGINFNKITTVNPIGNVTSSNNYNYLDFSAYSPITYYRLKMVDLDYTFEYSNIISVENGVNKDKTVIVYPNPASSELYIKLIAPTEKEAIVSMKDIYGRVIFEEKINLTQTVDNTFIKTSSFASGTYIVSITAGNTLSENIKVIITNKN